MRSVPPSPSAKEDSNNWWRGMVAVVGVAALSLCVALIAKRYFLHDAPIPMGPHHAHTGPEGSPEPFFSNFFKVYVPRRVCMFYEPAVVWLHLLSDFLIGLSYYSIPVALVFFVRRRRDLAFTWIFWMFAAFILLCGTTHFIGMWALWQPLYKVDGVIKLLTGLVSVVTAIALWPLIPKALALPSPAELEGIVRQRTSELARANEELKLENAARKKAEQERQALLDRERAARWDAERASRLKDEFLTTLSHELRTPLHAILGWTQLVKRKVEGTDIAADVAVIERNTRTQAHLIEDLLDLSRIVSGKLRLDVQPVNLREVVDDAMNAVRVAAEAKAIVLHTAEHTERFSVFGDPARLQQIIWNLLSNAVKFTQRNGRVEVSMRQRSGNVEIVVTDTGQGIAPEFLPHLFERFTQGDSSSSRRHGGLGIGLALVKHLAELHGGTVHAFSDGQGKGATFIVCLPLRGALREGDEERPAKIFAGPAGTDGVPSLRGLKVLVIDDEPDARELMRRLLEESGMEVFLASSAAEGYELLLRERPSAVLCDIGMPEEDGYSFIRRVRALSPEAGGATPVVAVTAFARPEDVRAATESGFRGHLAKPFEGQDLLMTVAYAVAG